MRFAVLALVAGCKVLPPPPVLPPHALAAADPPGVTTAMVVLGVADQFMNGGGGWGVALRLEQQQTDRSTIGVELTGGRGGRAEAEGGEVFRHWLLGVRTYGRFAVDPTGPLALTAGVGVSLTASGLVTGTLHGGLVLAADLERLIPGHVGAALALPLRRGRAYRAIPFSVGRGPQTEEPFLRPRPELYLAGGLGLIAPLGDTGHRLSLDLTLATTLRKGSGLLAALSVAEAYRHLD